MSPRATNSTAISKRRSPRNHGNSISYVYPEHLRRQKRRTTGDIAGHNAGKRCYLLELPSELRILIYEELFAAIRPPFDADPSCYDRLEPDLMRSCKFIRGEMKGLYACYLSSLFEEAMKELPARHTPFQGFEGRHVLIQEGNEIRINQGLSEAVVECVRWMTGPYLARIIRLATAIEGECAEVVPKKSPLRIKVSNALRDLKNFDLQETLANGQRLQETFANSQHALAQLNAQF